MNIHQRLSEALQIRGMAITEFQRELQRRGLRKASYSTINRYIRGESSPPYDFLREAAAVLGVSEEWLVRGPDETDGRVDQAELELLRWQTEVRRIEGVIKNQFPYYMGLPTSVREMVFHVYRNYLSYNTQYRFCRIPTTDEEARFGHDAQLARDIGRLLMEPLRLLTTEEETVLPRRMERYLYAMCAALTALIPDEGELAGEELHDLLEMQKTRRDRYITPSAQPAESWKEFLRQFRG